MNRRWLGSILLISFVLLATIKAHEICALRPFWIPEKVLRLKHFETARTKLHGEKLELLNLWESILTGRPRVLSEAMKARFGALGLKHVFTPSGFHMTAVLSPVIRVLGFPLPIILLSALGLSFLPGLSALKRMLLIRAAQTCLSLRTGFVVALILDVLFGTFQSSPLSFTYSFLFLGIVYSGAFSLGLFFWFFAGQVLIAYFQDSLISPQILLWGAVLNFGFTLTLPALALLAWPLSSWQLQLGLTMLSWLYALIKVAAQALIYTPACEVHSGFLVLVLIGLIRKKDWIPPVMLSLSSSLY